MPRPRSVISPPLERATKAKPAPVVAQYEWRSRATQPGPFGDAELPFYGIEEAVWQRAEADTLAGMVPVVEVRVPGAGWSRRRRVPTVQDLAQAGLAREAPDGRAWIIQPEGYRLIREAQGLAPHPS